MRRKQFIVGTGFGLVGLVLAACTTYGRKPEAAGEATAQPAEGTPSADESQAPAAAAAAALAKSADVPVGSGVIVGEIVITQPTAGDFKGFSSTCTHSGCTLNEVVDGTINCPCHGSKFNLDGSVANGPAAKPLTPEPISVQGDSIVAGG